MARQVNYRCSKEYHRKIFNAIRDEIFNTYHGIPCDFLKLLFGEDWKSIYDHVYQDDIENFIKDYEFELQDFIEN